jgi:hypothetical protein
MKIVVFDLDETLGYFVQYGIFWDCLNSYLLQSNNNNNKLDQPDQPDFDNILDLYPEFLRPNIMQILDYLKKKKHTQCCEKIMIYTNNQGHQSWTNNIISYFEKKLNYKLFDKIISAFKINGKRIEIYRTTNNKTYNDFMRCTLLPKNAQICYLDDTYYPEMINENVYYINIKPYMYDLATEEMNKRFLESNLGKKLISKEEIKFFINFMEENSNQYDFYATRKDEEDYKVDIILSKRILYHLHEFFSNTLPSYKNKTRKKYKHHKVKNKSMKNISYTI